MTLRVLSVFGTRPEAVKMAPVVQELARTPGISPLICVTAQHRQMLDQVLSLFNLHPDIDLNLMRPNQSLAELSALLVATAGLEPLPWLTERAGLYHLAGSGCCSRLEWGQTILKLDPHPEEQLTREILPALTADFPTPAQRPLFSALDCSRFTRTFDLRLPDWQAALRLAMEAV